MQEAAGVWPCSARPSPRGPVGGGAGARARGCARGPATGLGVGLGPTWGRESGMVGPV